MRSWAEKEHTLDPRKRASTLQDKATVELLWSLLCFFHLPYGPEDASMLLDCDVFESLHRVCTALAHRMPPSSAPQHFSAATLLQKKAKEIVAESKQKVTPCVAVK